MTETRARLLAILKEPERFAIAYRGSSGFCVVDTQTEERLGAYLYGESEQSCADLNASHRLERLCEEIAKVARDFPETPVGAYAGLMMTACRATSKDIAAAILALGEDK